MSLLSRLVQPAEGEEKIAVHAFQSALGEYKRSAPGVTLAAIATAFTLDAGEQADLATLAALFVSDVIDGKQLDDVLLMGEHALYTIQECQDRILTPSAPNLDRVLNQARVDAVRIGLNDFVLNGAAVSAQGSPNMTLAVAKGGVMSNGTMRAVTAGNVTIAAADSALSRLDLVVVSSAGTKTVRQGTPATSPVIGGFVGGDVPLALVYVPPGTTAIDSGKMLDVRIVRTRGSLTIGQITTAVVRNNTSAQQVFIDMAIPNGLFLAGRAIRVRCGGTMLLNSGTPTVTLAIAYGGTVMFQDASSASIADADRLAWFLDFNLCAQANNDQALNGMLQLGPLSAARTAATSGTGELANAAAVAGVQPSASFNGSAAVDSDAADRSLQVAWTMSVANAANEIVMEYGSAELL